MQERQLSRFGDQLTLNEVAEGRYESTISEQWAQGRAVFGGVVAALMARVLERHVPVERRLRSALIDFVAPAAPATVVIEAKVLREGRALTHAEARMLQNGELLAVFIGTYGHTRPTSVHVQGAPAATTSAPEELVRMPYVEGIAPRFTQHFEYRLHPGAGLYSGSTKATVGGYVRHPQGGPIDAAGLLGLIDAWPAAILPMLKRPAPASSVTWMVDLVGDTPAHGSESDDFFRYESHAVAASGGYASCEARLWNARGELMAASRQLVVEFSQP
jgi:acyl-CoA thioesterase